MVIVGLFIRLRIAESPEFEAVKDNDQILKQPALEAIRSDWRNIIRIIGLRLAETGGYYVTTAFTVTYVGLAAITDKTDVLIGTLIGSAVGLVSHLLYGAWSDRIGRKKVFLIGSDATILLGIPMFLLINTGSMIMIVVAITCSLVFSHDPIFAVESSWFSELFPRRSPHIGNLLGLQRRIHRRRPAALHRHRTVRLVQLAGPRPGVHAARRHLHRSCRRRARDRSRGPRAEIDQGGRPSTPTAGTVHHRINQPVNHRVALTAAEMRCGWSLRAVCGDNRRAGPSSGTDASAAVNGAHTSHPDDWRASDDTNLQRPQRIH